jgi:hypothetical protein
MIFDKTSNSECSHTQFNFTQVPSESKSLSSPSF